jgi:hypothetical protein
VAKTLHMRGTLKLVSSLIVVIARRDGRGQEHDLATERLAPASDDRRRQAPARVELPAWHEHEEDD